jgi:hypothetical protein
MTLTTQDGYGFVIFAAILNGSFLVPFKFDGVAKYKLEPIVFELYFGVGVCIMCWLIQCLLPINPEIYENGGNRFKFVPLGLISGCCYTISIYST